MVNGQAFTLSRQAAWVLDADGLPLPRNVLPDGSVRDYGQLKFGSKPTFWLGMTSERDENLSFLIGQTSPPANLPTATTITLGTTYSGQVNDFVEHDFEFTLNSWQWVKVAASRGSLEWRLKSAGGAGWAERSISSMTDVAFLNKEVLLPSGQHRLTLTFSSVAFEPQANYQFTVTGRPHDSNPHVTDVNPCEYVPQGRAFVAALVSVQVRFQSSWRQPTLAPRIN